MAWHDISDFTSEITWQFQSRKGSLDDITFQRDIVSMLCMLLDALQIDCTSFERLQIFALLVFLRTFCRPIDGLKQRSRLIVQRMVQTHCALQPAASGTLLWILMMAAIVAEEKSPEQAYVLACLRRQDVIARSSDSGQSNWLGVKEILRTFPWIDEVHGHASEVVWKQVCLT